MEVLGGVVGPVAEGVLHGLTGIQDEGGPVWNEVVTMGIICTREESCVWGDGVSIRGGGVLDVG